MDLFGKKRIAELEKENKKLQEEKDRALNLYNTTVKNHSDLEREYRKIQAENNSLQLVMESKNNKVRELEDKVRLLELDIKDSEMMIKDREEKIGAAKDRLNKMICEIRSLDTEVKEYRRLFEIIENKDIVKFRKLRGEALNTKSKRIRDKKLKQLEAHTEKIFKMIEEYKKLSLKKYSNGIKFAE